MKNNLIYYLVLFLIVIKSGISQSIEEKESLLGPKIGTRVGGYLNAGTNGLEIDGFFEIQNKNGLFADLWITQMETANGSVGIMRAVSPGLTLGGGYSHYSEIDVEANMLHEIFFGADLNFFTGALFLSIGEDTDPNLIGILDIGALIKDSPMDISSVIVRDNNGQDISINISKDFRTGFTMGYVFSLERYEGQENRIFNKDGINKTYYVTIQDQGYFHNIFIGFIF